MKLTQDRQTFVLIALVAVFVLLNGYRIMTGEKPKTAPLTYQRGAVATSPVRQWLSSRADPLNVFLERRQEKFPGVARDIFRMEDPAPKKKPKAAPAPPPPPPPPPPPTPEELAAQAAKVAADQAAAAAKAAADAAAAAVRAAADAARQDLSKFKFLGYLTEKDSTLFLSKDGELFIVKKGSNILKSYRVKDANRNYVVLFDTLTGVEVRVELPGESASQQPALQQPQQPPFPRSRRQ